MGQVIDTDHNLPQELLDFIITTSISPGPIHRYTGWDIETSLDVLLDTKKRERRSLFEDSGDEEDIDINGWTSKPPKVWGTRDTKNWLLSAAGKLGLLYHEIPPELVMPGENLLLLSRQDFLSYDLRFGEKFYDALYRGWNSKCANESSDDCQSQKDEGKVKKCIKKIKRNDGQMRLPSGNLNGTKRRTIKRRNARQRTETGSPKIWEFVRSLLLDRRYCPELIRWENYNEKTFRFVKTREIAQLWGSRNLNKNMNYEKFSRALRYYYKKDILQPVLDRQRVYKFGPMAKGLETDNPNFGFEHR